MKVKHIKTPESTEEVSPHQGEKWLGSQKRHRNTLLPEKSGGRIGIRTCKSMEQDQTRKRAHAGRGPDAKREIPVKA
jgi:hypothetical protein